MIFILQTVVLIILIFRLLTRVERLEDAVRLLKSR